jgi:hypothetical protein
VISYAEQGRLAELSIPVESAFLHLSSLTISQDGERYYLNGGVLTPNRVSPRPEQDGLYRAYSQTGRFIGLANVEGAVIKSSFSIE